MPITAVANITTDIAAHKRLMYYALRPQLFFDQIADVDSTDATNIGSSVNFYFTADMAAATTALNETNDTPMPTTITDSSVNVTLQEYGNAAQTTALARGTSFIDLNTSLANVLGYNAGLTIDTLAVNALAAGTNNVYSTVAGGAGTYVTTGTEAANNRIIAADVMSGNMVRFATAKLRAANVDPWMDSLYRGFMHPDVGYDFKGATGGTNWSDPHMYAAPEAIFNGVVGAFQGVLWIETPRAPAVTNAGDGAGGAGNVDAYYSLICGRQALAKAFSAHPEYGALPTWVETPVIDLLRRFRGAGWKWLGNYKVFRQESVWKLVTSSSIGNNTT
jgi:N4-gp56 family major capsid protein